MQRWRSDRHERWAERKLADELRVGDITDIEIDDRGGISHRGHLAIQADIRRSVKSLRPFAFGLPGLLPWHPPSAGLLRLRGIADVQNHQDVRAEARRRRRQVGVLAARI